MLRSLLIAAALTPLAQAAGDLHCYYETDPAGLKLTCQLTDGAGPGFALLVSIGGETFEQPGSLIAGIATLDGDGFGKLEYTFPAEVLPLPEDSWLTFAAVYKDNGAVLTPQADLVLGKSFSTDTLDFDFTLGPDDGEIMQAGRVIDEQWAAAGMHISADNKDVSHPDKAILFDTDDPTGGDDDLGVGLGMGLIIAEDDWDGDDDGLVDDPDDEQKGGSILFDFDAPATVTSVRLIDIDETPGTQLRFYRNGDLETPTDVMTILSLGDGAIQDVHFHEEKVDRLEVFLKGSGMVGGAELILCPRTIDFDETPLGIPLGFQAGQWITDEFAHLGVTVSAINNHPEHPQKAILFDSANPTGEDDDLLTPNPDNPTNDEALGFVFILAEDDVDADDDGLVDDPDDEQAGGQIRIDFDVPTTVLDLKVLDCDAQEIDLVICQDADANVMDVIVVPDLPDGSVQTVPVMQSGISTLILDLGGSGAMAKLRFCPDPVSDE